jgi:hypothetical protein
MFMVQFKLLRVFDPAGLVTGRVFSYSYSFRLLIWDFHVTFCTYPADKLGAYGKTCSIAFVISIIDALE